MIQHAANRRHCVCEGCRGYAVTDTYSNRTPTVAPFALRLYFRQCTCACIHPSSVRRDSLSQMNRNSPRDVDVINRIIDSATQIKNFVVGSNGESLGDVLSDVTLNVRNLEHDVDIITSDAGNYNNAIVYTILCSVTVCIGISVALSVSHGLSEKLKTNAKCVTNTCSCCVICAIVTLLIIAAIYNFVVVICAGFCSDPFTNLAGLVLEDDVASGDKPTKITFYLVCPTYDMQQTVANWPWRQEQIETTELFNTITESLRELKLDDIGGSKYRSLEASINAVGNTFSADDGVFGPQGFFSCQLVERFLQDIIINVCTDWYRPTAILMECFVVLGVAIVALQVLQTCLRRETEENSAVDITDAMEMQKTAQNPTVAALKEMDAALGEVGVALREVAVGHTSHQQSL
eukprot:m.112648 g.112648  ORF g.112648 m.112648 type:complete len:405 (+) comp17032_c1_seq36:1462-2676(+)